VLQARTGAPLPRVEWQLGGALSGEARAHADLSTVLARQGLRMRPLNGTRERGVLAGTLPCCRDNAIFRVEAIT
jgi:hypothetical protein